MIIVERDGPVAIVTLNRPDAMNALSRALRAALDDTITRLSTDDSVSVIVLTGAGRAFTAGLDLKELGSDATGLAAANATTSRENPVLAIEQCPKPIIAAVNGVAITGGFEVALACDVILASTNARFADTHGRVGIMPGWGLSQRLSRVIGIYRAKELSLTGNFLDAETACAWGLVNRVVAPEELMSAALQLARDMASIPADTLARYKSIIDEGFAQSFAEGMSTEKRRSIENNRAVTPEMVEQRRAAIQARGRTQS